MSLAPFPRPFVSDYKVFQHWQPWAFLLAWIEEASGGFAGSGLDTMAEKIRQKVGTVVIGIRDGTIAFWDLAKVLVDYLRHRSKL